VEQCSLVSATQVKRRANRLPCLQFCHGLLLARFVDLRKLQFCGCQQRCLFGAAHSNQQPEENRILGNRRLLRVAPNQGSVGQSIRVGVHRQSRETCSTDTLAAQGFTCPRSGSSLSVVPNGELSFIISKLAQPRAPYQAREQSVGIVEFAVRRSFRGRQPACCRPVRDLTMKHYLLNVCYPAGSTQPPPDELKRIMSDVGAA
jgi:hypothetical protein